MFLPICLLEYQIGKFQICFVCGMKEKKLEEMLLNQRSVKELVQYFEENVSKPLPIPPPRPRRVAQLTQIKSALIKEVSSIC